MLRISDPRRRFAGRLIIVSAIAAALPLTASRAIQYVDVAAPPAPMPPTPEVVQAVRSATPVAAAGVVQAAPVRPARPERVTAHRINDLSINDDYVIIDGQRKRWEELTPTERERVRAAVAEARASLANVHIDRERIMRDVGNAASRVHIEEIRRNVANAQVNAAEAIRKIDLNSVELRRAGVDPERIKATVRGSLQSAQSINVEEIQRSLAAVDPQKIARTVSSAEESVRKARADLDRIDARLRNERR